MTNDEGFEILKEDFEAALNKCATKSIHSFNFLLTGGGKLNQGF